jgi:hypothetical protein
MRKKYIVSWHPKLNLFEASKLCGRREAVRIDLSDPQFADLLAKAREHLRDPLNITSEPGKDPIPAHSEGPPPDNDRSVATGQESGSFEFDEFPFDPSFLGKESFENEE